MKSKLCQIPVKLKPFNKNYYHRSPDIFTLLFIFILIILPGCASKAYITVTFDNVAVGAEITDASEISTAVLDTNINNSGNQPSEIRPSPIGACGGFYSKSNTLTFIPLFPSDYVYFKFAEFGGENQITINGNLIDADNMIDLHGVSGPNYEFSVSANQHNTNWYGFTGVSGYISSISIKGQELLVDDFIFVTESDHVPNRVLIDCRSAFGDMVNTFAQLQNLLTSYGYSVDTHTEGQITAAVLSRYDVYIAHPTNIDPLIEDQHFGYDPQEPANIENFVANGGGVFFFTEFGPHTFSDVFNFFLNPFSIIYNNDKVTDQTNHITEDFWVTYSHSRNFVCHPIINGVNEVIFKAASTVYDQGSIEVIKTDSDALPANSAVLVVKNYGAGRIAVVGDISWISLDDINEFDNGTLAKNIVHWLAFRL